MIFNEYVMDKAFQGEFFLAGIKLAELASGISREYFRKPVTIESKLADNPPVSIADCLGCLIPESIDFLVRNLFSTLKAVVVRVFCSFLNY